MLMKVLLLSTLVFDSPDPLVQGSNKIIGQSEREMNLNQTEHFATAVGDDKEPADELGIEQTGEFLQSVFDLFED